jgi:hypothetical protein
MGPDGSVGLPGPDGSVGLPGPDGSVGLPGPDASTNDGGSGTPDGMFTIGLRNETSRAVVLFVSGCMGEQHWFDMHEVGGIDLPGNGETLAIATNPTSCDCRGQSYEEAECAYPPAVCSESVFETLEPNAEKIYTWDTGHWFPTRDVPCANRQALDTGTQLELRMCWLGEVPASDNLQYPDDYTCTTSTFTLESRTGSEWLTIAD